MNGNIRIARVMGIPINVNFSWFITLAFVTSMLALRFYPEIIPSGSPYRDDKLLHWLMALSSGMIFFASILLHEIAHSVVAKKQGIAVKGITLFIFGGVAQITSESKRPLHEFVMAVVGPLTSIALSGVFFGLWWLVGGFSEDKPVPIVLEWLFLMNLVVGIFNLAPGFPMDGGRVLRSLLWGVTGSLYRATRWATLVGRTMGIALMGIGGLAFIGLIDVVDPLSGIWLLILGVFLESSARQSWLQAKALNTLGGYRAEEIMSRDLETVDREERVRYLQERGGRGRRFIFFVSDADRVLGVLTEKEIAALPADTLGTATAGEAMLAAETATVAQPRDDAATMLERMEAHEVWHLPIVSDSRVVGVVSKESLLRLLTGPVLRPRFARPA